MSVQRALIVDDEPDIRELLSITLGRMNVDSVAAGNIAEAHDILSRERFDLCLTDMKLPDGDGLDLVQHISNHYAEMPVAVITAHGNMESAVTALKSGAFDFVSKPVDLNDLRSLVGQALRLATQHATGSQTLIGESRVVEQLRQTIKKVARSQAPVYISGESGTGKELVARLIHEQGARAEAAFVPVNCGAIPAELMESELFGHIKGSFTGAVSDKQGLFQAADGGTLFLDEVADLPLQMQVKLLRAIQEKKVRPVGAETEVSIDCRVLSATHKPLAALVESGEFRQDLYYRINVIELKVAPLRERDRDVELLSDYFLKRKSDEFGVETARLTDDAKAALGAYAFPGNVRELENILERALTMCDDARITAEDLNLSGNAAQPAALSRDADVVVDEATPAQRSDVNPAELQSYLDDVERQRIIEALEKTRWNKTQAAKLLGISFRALRYRLQKLNIE